MSAAVLFLELRLPPTSMYIYIYVFWFQLYGPKKDTLWLFKSFQWNPWPIEIDHSHFAKLKFTPLPPKTQVAESATNSPTRDSSPKTCPSKCGKISYPSTKTMPFMPCIPLWMSWVFPENRLPFKYPMVSSSCSCIFPNEYGNKLERPTCFGCVWVFVLLKVKPLNLLFGGQEFLFGYVSEFDIWKSVSHIPMVNLAMFKTHYAIPWKTCWLRTVFTEWVTSSSHISMSRD